ncbi:MAG: patatin-like phospholipase family protein [Nanoarchaeota archaeon]|nr:patatin-like phospholipase family protein [Nanoarchaeota archaeon]MBU1850439.1 patatin-like phospholipase family protein [Nanoarchaeota archaeon]
MGIGLALGGGGARALASIGVIKVLLKNNIEIDEVSGTSMGAAIGAYFCATKEIEQLEQKVLFMKKTEYVKLIDLNKLNQSIIKGNKIEEFLRTNIKKERFGQLKIPLKVVATNLLSGEEVVFKRGKLISAIMASVAVPGLFPPVKKGRKFLVDGGIINPTPISALKSKKILAIDFTTNKTTVNKIDTFNVISLSFSIIRRYQEKFKNNENLIILKPKTGLELTGLLRFDKAEQFMKAGEEAAKKNLKKIKEMIK